MNNKKFLFVLILLLALIFQIYGLVRYYERLPNDILGNILYLVTIICLISAVVLVFLNLKNKSFS
jgi:hypothetical protein